MRLYDDDVQEFDTRWDQALRTTSEILPVNVLKGLYKSTLQDSIQLHTELALYELENVRNNDPPNCCRLKTMVRRRIGQTMRTRNLRARNEIVERGAVSQREKIQR